MLPKGVRSLAANACAATRKVSMDLLKCSGKGDGLADAWNCCYMQALRHPGEALRAGLEKGGANGKRGGNMWSHIPIERHSGMLGSVRSLWRGVGEPAQRSPSFAAARLSDFSVPQIIVCNIPSGLFMIVSHVCQEQRWLGICPSQQSTGAAWSRLGRPCCPRAALGPPMQRSWPLILQPGLSAAAWPRL